MALGLPLPGGWITQRFGPSTQAVQPSMYYLGTVKAFWQPFPGQTGWHPDVHAGTDFAGKAAGSPLVAAEAGVVTRAEYDRYNGGGWVVEVEIRPGVRYSYNHCQSLKAWVGQKVARGAIIAYVGATGTIWTGSSFVRSTYGVHCHAVLLIKEKSSDGVWRTMLYDFADFMAGGSHAGSTLVKPPTTVIGVPATLKPGFNVRSSPDLDVGSTNIVYITRADGVYNRLGTRVANLTGWRYVSSTNADGYTWGKIYGLRRYVYVVFGGFTK